MDLATLSADDEATLTLRHPVTGAELADANGPVTITLAGADSDRYRAAQRAIANRNIKAFRKGGTPTVEQIDADGLELLVACTIRWHGIELDGAPLDCTAANARRLYSDPRARWLREQVDAFVADRGNFWAASSTS